MRGTREWPRNRCICSHYAALPNSDRHHRTIIIINDSRSIYFFPFRHIYDYYILIFYNFFICSMVCDFPRFTFILRSFVSSAFCDRFDCDVCDIVIVNNVNYLLRICNFGAVCCGPICDHEMCCYCGVAQIGQKCQSNVKRASNRPNDT